MPPPEASLWRDDRRRREDPRQYRDRALRAHRGRLGRAQTGAEQCHRRWRARPGGRRRRLSRACPAHGSDALRRDLIGGLTGRAFSGSCSRRLQRQVAFSEDAIPVLRGHARGGARWTYKKSKSSTLISRSCSATRASWWCRARRRRTPPRSMSATNSSACCSSTTRTKSVLTISRWPFWAAIWTEGLGLRPWTKALD